MLKCEQFLVSARSDDRAYSNEYVTEERHRRKRKGPQVSLREYFNRLLGVFAGFVFFIFTTQAQPVRSKPEYQETPGEGLAPMREIISRVPTGKASAYGLLKIRDSDGRRNEIPVKYLLRTNE